MPQREVFRATSILVLAYELFIGDLRQNAGAIITTQIICHGDSEVEPLVLDPIAGKANGRYNDSVDPVVNVTDIGDKVMSVNRCVGVFLFLTSFCCGNLITQNLP